MSRHAKPKQATLSVSVTCEELALLNSIRVYRGTENPDHLGLVTRKFVDLLPPYGSDRKREPGRHARRWDA